VRLAPVSLFASDSAAPQTATDAARLFCSPQAFRAYATAAVQLDRRGSAQAHATVENSVSVALRFLGYLTRVETPPPPPAPPTLLSLLDGDAIARFVAFALTVRCVCACACAWLQRGPKPPLSDVAGRAAATRRSDRNPAGIATDVSSLVSVMTFLAPQVEASESVAVQQLMVRGEGSQQLRARASAVPPASRSPYTFSHAACPPGSRPSSGVAADSAGR